jgi:hypothetical protein
VPTEFTITLRNTPGALAELGLALGNKGINIEGLQGMSFANMSTIRFVVNDPDAAERELEDFGMPFRCREVVAVDVHDQPGTLGKLAEALAAAGVNIDAVYITMGRRIILGVNDLDKTVAIAQGMGLHSPG